MADSIAKLAVVITGDAGPLAREMNRAGNIVKGADTKVVNLSKSLSALRGNWSAAFSMGGGGALAITAMAAGVFKLAAAGDQLMQKIGADKLETWAGQWERLNEQIGIMGMTFTTIAKEASSGLADRLAAINKALFPESVAFVEAIKAREAAEKRITEEKKKQEERNKKQLQLNKEAAEAQQKERDELLKFKQQFRDRGEDIRQSVQTPEEQMRAAFAELRSLMAGGFIDEETAMRAGLKARKAFDEGSGGNRRDDQGRQGIAAADKFTMAGFSAVQGGLREIERLERVQKDQLKEEQNQTAVQKEIRDILHGQTPIILHEGEP